MKKTKRKASRLNEKLNSSSFHTDTSFSFLDKSASVSDTAADTESVDSSDSNDTCSIDKPFSLTRAPRQYIPELTSSFQMNTEDYSQLCGLIRENNALQRKQLNMLKKMKTSIATINRPSTSNTVPSEPVQLVLYEGRVTLLGRNNMDHQQYAMFLTRKLFDDDK